MVQQQSQFLSYSREREGISPYAGYIGMYGPKGYGFFSRFGQKWVTILATLVSNKAWFCSLVYNPAMSTKALHNASNIGLNKEQTVSRVELKALFHDKEDDSNTSD